VKTTTNKHDKPPPEKHLTMKKGKTYLGGAEERRGTPTTKRGI